MEIGTEERTEAGQHCHSSCLISIMSRSPITIESGLGAVGYASTYFLPSFLPHSTKQATTGR